MSKVYLVVENDEGLDEVVKVFADSAKADEFAEELRYANRSDVAVVEMEVE